MAQIRDIKKRIKSVTNTQKVTHAMELVSAAKMRKSQHAALSGRPYTLSLHEVLANIKAKTALVHPLLTESGLTKELVVVVSSDRGLAGGLNLNVFREILRSDIKNASYITVGKKAKDFVAKGNWDLVASYGSEEIPFIALSRILAKSALDAFLKKEVGKVSIIYPHFQSTVAQNPKWIQLLPIPSLEESLKEIAVGEEFIFEPNAKQILGVILKHHVLTEVYQTLIEAKASEHSARMVAMKNATDAAEDLVEDLTLTYNQARQEAITKELLDIVTAQKAVQ